MDYGYQTSLQSQQKYWDFVLTTCVEFQCYRLKYDPTDFNTGQLSQNLGLSPICEQTQTYTDNPDKPDRGQ